MTMPPAYTIQAAMLACTLSCLLTAKHVQAGPCAVASTYLELPQVKAPRPKCKQSYSEWNIFAFAAAQPNVKALLAGIPKPMKQELLVTLPASSKGVEAQAGQLKGANHFAVAHTLDYPHNAALNKLVQMANAELVVLVLPGQESMAGAVLEAAQREFSLRPNLGLLGLGSGYSSPNTTVSQPGEFIYVAAATWAAPIVVRRQAFLQVGGLSEQACSGGCQESASLELSVRLWNAGYSAGTYGLDGQASATCTDPAHLAMLSEPLAAKVTAESDRVDNGAHIPLSHRVPIAACSKGQPPSSKCPGAGAASVSIILQFFRRGKNIKKIMQGIKSTAKGAEVLINNDSRSDWGAWMAGLSGLPAGGLMVYSPNIHEIRGYNRLAKLASGHLLVFMQDDDAPAAPNWIKSAQLLFKHHGSMQLLGGLRGRMDLGKVMDPKYNYVNGPKYGPPSEARSCCEKIPTSDPKTGLKFMFAYKVNMGPMLAPRRSFLASGMYNTALSCPGDPGIGFDFEYSIRMWYTGKTVGLYDSGFQQDIGDHEKSGTRSNSKIYDVRRANELRNNKLMYSMYKGFHHQKGTARAMAMWNTLKQAKGFKRPNEKTATATYIKEVLYHRPKSSGGGADNAASVAKKAGVLGIIKDRTIAKASTWHPKRKTKGKS